MPSKIKILVLACFEGQAIAASLGKRDFWGLDPSQGHWVRHNDQIERLQDFNSCPEGVLWSPHSTWVPAEGAGGESITVHVRPIRRDPGDQGVHRERSDFMTAFYGDSVPDEDYDYDGPGTNGTSIGHPHTNGTSVGRPDTNGTSIRRRSIDFQPGVAVYLEKARIAPKLHLSYCKQIDKWFSQDAVGTPDKPDPADRTIQPAALRAMRSWVLNNPGLWYFPIYRQYSPWVEHPWKPYDLRSWLKFIAVKTQSGHWAYFEGRVRWTAKHNEFLIGSPEVSDSIWLALKNSIEYPPPPVPRNITAAHGRLDCVSQKKWWYEGWDWAVWRIRGKEALKIESKED